MRIYFGREPSGTVESLDVLLLAYLRANDWDWERSHAGMIFNLLPHKTYHTINPLIINYLDNEAAKAIVWIIDEHGEHVRMGDFRQSQIISLNFSEYLLTLLPTRLKYTHDTRRTRVEPNTGR